MATGISRREFLMRVGQAGGYGAAFLTMQGLGLMSVTAEAAPRLDIAPDAGKGVRVAILGGGIAGLVAAYEMKPLGYECTVLEARTRPGGRNWTVRRGDAVQLTDGTTQTCVWSAGQYQNFGPARLPSAHTTMLGYCRKLGVAMEVEINTNRSTRLENPAVGGGLPVEQRQVVNDARGHVSELLAKCIRQGALNAELSVKDRDRMLSFLRMYGPLDRAGRYTGSERSGYAKLPGAGDDAGVLRKPIDMDTLLDENFWGAILFEEMFDMQATMFQPVGGMDRIPYAFAKALGETVRYGAVIKEIRKTSSGVRVVYTQQGAEKTLDADYCICSLPLVMLRKVVNDFSPPYRKVITECTYGNAYKIAWESRRFWEQDLNIYGGLENVTEGPTPVWLPSGGLFTERGVLVSGYAFESADAFARLSLEEKFAASRQTVERLHPGHGKELENPVYVPWIRVPFNEGSWIASYGPGQNAYDSDAIDPGYELLLEPDGPVYFVGEHVSHIRAWQEGAALSALRAAQMIGERERIKRA
ncbi:MAG TPA: FAD-dependent oxidoreductase [Terracidiphilus sp.]|nr:FAD-dependent oxidoreductase [Terracidiphilus sp.]